jgi:rSAM/selenodomain-associated transferase 1
MRNTQQTELLILMARYPRPGKVKTRLAADIGARRAASLYRGWLGTLAREFSHAPFAVEWRYTPARAPFARVVGRNGAARRPQPEGDLGERMRCIFDESFQRGHRHVVMIGTDAPQMNQATVRRAFRLLRQHHAVVQPTEDGGYALIGLARPLDIFSGIAWSSTRVMNQTRQRLRALDASFAELPATFDVDTMTDLNKLARA